MVIKHLHPLQIKHLKDQLEAIDTIKRHNLYRRNYLQQQKNINYKNEYDRLIGELSQTNLPDPLRTKLTKRKNLLKKLYEDSEEAKQKIFSK